MITEPLTFNPPLQEGATVRLVICLPINMGHCGDILKLSGRIFGKDKCRAQSSGCNKHLVIYTLPEEVQS